MNNITRGKVVFGEPVETLPRKTTKAGTHHNPWDQIAAHCKKHPNLYVPCTIEGYSRGVHACAVARIREKRFVAFREGQWEAAFISGQLYVKHITDDAPASDGEKVRLVVEKLIGAENE